MVMSAEADSMLRVDSGLEALVTLLHFQGVAADRQQIRHRMATDKIGTSEILRCAKDLGLKARACRSQWSRLAKTRNAPGATTKLKNTSLPSHRLKHKNSTVRRKFAIAQTHRNQLAQAFSACGKSPRP